MEELRFRSGQIWDTFSPWCSKTSTRSSCSRRDTAYQAFQSKQFWKAGSSCAYWFHSRSQQSSDTSSPYPRQNYPPPLSATLNSSTHSTLNTPKTIPNLSTYYNQYQSPQTTLSTHTISHTLFSCRMKCTVSSSIKIALKLSCYRCR